MSEAGSTKFNPADLDAGIKAAWEYVRSGDTSLLELKGYGVAIARLSDLTSDDELRGAFWALGDAVQGHAESMEKAKSTAFHAMHPLVYPGMREENAKPQAPNIEKRSASHDNEKDIS